MLGAVALWGLVKSQGCAVGANSPFHELVGDRGEGWVSIHPSEFQFLPVG